MGDYARIPYNPKRFFTQSASFPVKDLSRYHDEKDKEGWFKELEKAYLKIEKLDGVNGKASKSEKDKEEVYWMGDEWFWEQFVNAIPQEGITPWQQLKYRRLGDEILAQCESAVKGKGHLKISEINCELIFERMKDEKFKVDMPLFHVWACDVMEAILEKFPDNGLDNESPDAE